MAKVATIEYRDPYCDGGILTVWTSSAGYAPYGEALGDTAVVIFRDEPTGAFVGLEVDDLRALPGCVEELEALPLEHLDVPAAGLDNVHPGVALRWGYEHLAPRLQNYTLPELQVRLGATDAGNLSELQAIYRDFNRSGAVPAGVEREVFMSEIVEKIGAAFDRRDRSLIPT